MENWIPNKRRSPTNSCHAPWKWADKQRGREAIVATEIAQRAPSIQNDAKAQAADNGFDGALDLPLRLARAWAAAGTQWLIGFQDGLKIQSELARAIQDKSIDLMAGWADLTCSPHAATQLVDRITETMDRTANAFCDLGCAICECSGKAAAAFGEKLAGSSANS